MMDDWRRKKTFLLPTLSLGILLLFSWCILPSSETQAGGLKDVISDLYGGNGFQSYKRVSGRSNEFGSRVLNDFNDLTNEIGSQIGNFAVNSTVGGFRFDVERGVPVQETTSLGPIFAERADTVGKGRFDFQVVWSRADYQKFNGDDLSDLEGSTLPETANPNLPGSNERLLINLDAEVITDFVGFFGTYGVMDNWDVNLLVPIVHTKVKARARARLVNANGEPCAVPGNCIGVYEIDGTGPGTGDAATDSSSGESTGIGDVVLRSKYNFLKNHETLPDLGIRGGVSFPTGDEDDFQGIGDFSFSGLAVASKYFPSPIGMIGPHANLGVSIVANQSGRNLFTYVGGFDVAPIPRVAISLDLIGRHELDDKDNSGNDIIDLAPGVKWAPWSNTLLQAAIQVPLNKNQGLRPDLVWTAGIGGTF